MLKAANANDRAAILYMAKAYETGIGLGTERYELALLLYHHLMK